jgi:phage-related protein|nr:MAG TPA: minor tail protein [Caudoviricetes sp.]
MATSIGQIALDLVVNQNQFQQQMNGITKLAKKAGVALAAAFGTKKLIDFGKQCLELGSDLAEVQNVVDVTFPHMTAKVDEFAKSAAQSFGLSETMAKQYTGTFGAMAKAFGFTEQQAYDMGSTLTGLAGDVASFYNLSQDEAYTKLKSVFTGETESLKDLGVVMTQTALDSYALANGFGKTTSQMTEAEKVALRYSFVQKQLSAASGDFARTSGSWANQVRILKLQFDSLKATIGQGLINLFTPIIKAVNTLIGKLATLANAFKSFTELITGRKSSGSSTVASPVSDLANTAGDAEDGLENASGAADDLSKSTNNVGSAAKKAAKQLNSLMGFDQINKLDKKTDTTTTNNKKGTGTGSLGDTVDFGNLAEGETVADKVNDKFTKMFKNILKYVEPTLKALKKLYNEGLSRLGNFAWGALKDFYNGFLVPVGKWVMGKGLPEFINALNDGLMNVNFDKIRAALNDLWKALTPFAINIGEGLLWFWKNVLVPLGTWTANEVVPRFLTTLSTAIKIVNSILTALQPLFQWFWDSVLQPLAQWTGGIFLTVWDGINNVLQKFADWCSANPEIIQTVAIVIASFFAAWKITEFVSMAAGFITTLVNIIGSIHSAAGALSLVKTGISALVGALGGPFTIAIAAAIAVGVLLWKNWDTVKEKCAQLRDWVVDKTVALKDGAVEAFQTLIENIKEAMKVIVDCVKEKWENAKTKFSEFSTWMHGVFTKDWSKDFGTLGKILNTFLKGVKDIWNGIKRVFNGIIEFVTGVFTGNWTQAWEGIKNIFGGIFDGLITLAKTPLNVVIDIINSLMEKLNSGLSAIESAFSFSYDFKNPITGTRHYGHYGLSLPRVPTIPHLAEGGFVQKNTPQLAMIGDNLHQGEVVAPEGKMLEMARAAAELSGGDAARLLQELIDLIKNMPKDFPIVSLDPETLRKYFIEKTNQNTKAKGKSELIY